MGNNVKLPTWLLSYIKWYILPIPAEELVTQRPDTLLVEPLETVLALEHLPVPVPALSAVAVRLALVSLVRRVPLQALKAVGELTARLEDMEGNLLSLLLLGLYILVQLL